MADIYHFFGSDLNVAPNGDLATVDGLLRGNQRILRRLITNPNDYLWNPAYGAGVGSMVGQLPPQALVGATIRTQIMQEACVGNNPLPVITSTPIPEGIYVSIQYENVETGSQATLAFGVTE